MSGEAPLEAKMEQLATPSGADAAVSNAELTEEEKQARKEAKKAAKAAEKAAKEAAKAQRAQQRGQKEAPVDRPDPDDPLKDRYGDLPLIQSAERTDRVWTTVADLTAADAGKEVLLRGRLHTSRGKGKSAFLVLRQNTATVQLVMFADDKTVSKHMIKYAMALPRESIIEVTGVAKDAKVEACSQSDVELAVTSIRAITRAAALPFEVVDAARSDVEVAELQAKGEVMPTVSQDVRLNKRYIDLRTPANQAIFRVQSQVCQLFRESMLKNGFVEVHTPKIIAGSSEGGAAVFKLDYMGTSACLAQSPQLYKQMCVMSDFPGVFEIGPVFRAEQSFTHRHLCEFTGLDFEMAIKEHYHEVLDVIDELFLRIFDGLNERCAHELETIAKQYPFTPLRYLRKAPRIPFVEGIKMLQDAGFADADPDADLSTELERELGRLVAEKYNTDFYFLTRFPLAARPFYTMPAPDDPTRTNSFDIFIRGEEIISGAQRIHEPELLAKRAAECGIEVASIQDYIDAMKFGAYPHGGVGVGLERVVMLFLGLNNIRKTSMFPRDPKRLTP
ncbi:unnamed protein product [Pedinophyceae sp. YPF-701]|nr:unnamed protein product [Pedinophyceae sp. YPF-701]